MTNQQVKVGDIVVFEEYLSSPNPSNIYRVLEIENDLVTKCQLLIKGINKFNIGHIFYKNTSADGNGWNFNKALIDGQAKIISEEGLKKLKLELL